jgi:hypothetical protein
MNRTVGTPGVTAQQPDLNAEALYGGCSARQELIAGLPQAPQPGAGSGGCGWPSAYKRPGAASAPGVCPRPHR